MATCKDCVHAEVCETFSLLSESFEIASPERIASDCEHFKHHSRFVELPCKDGEYVYVIEPLCDSMAFHTIKLRKIKHIEPQARIQFAGGGWILNFLSAFNQYVFRTYEAAEQALKEREGQ